MCIRSTHGYQIKCNLDHCNREYLDTHELDRHKLKDHKNQKPNECIPIVNHKNQKCDDKEFISMNFENDEKSYKCEICGTSFLSMESCLNHYNSTHMKNQKEVQELSGKNNSASYQCEICEKTFQKRTSLQQHKLWHGERNHECDICHKMFPCEQFVKRHKNLIHFPNAIPCRWNCGQTFNSHGGRIKHEKIYHYLNKPLERICDICGKPCSTEIGLKNHKNTHLNPLERIEEYSCSICSETFPTAQQRTEHRKSVHNTAKFECPKCNKKFVKQKNMQVHVEKHKLPKKNRNENSYSCYQCSSDQKYSISSLRRHLKSKHSAVYKCKEDGCEKSFLYEKQFNAHMRNHQNRKCHLCSYVSTAKGSNGPQYARIHLIMVHKLTIEDLLLLGRYDPKIKEGKDIWLKRYVLLNNR